MTEPVQLGASFRDPSGFIFRRDGILYRQVNAAYQEDFACLASSGLSDELIQAHLLVPHETDKMTLAVSDGAIAVLRPLLVSTISYPYEWCFSQLQDAALLTLDVQKRALERGMSLKDASAYNVQFLDGRPILIDTLSFEMYKEGEPWVAYRQFCQHFLAPLALMAYTDVRMPLMLRCYIDGLPLDLTSGLLPKSSYLKGGILAHVHLHAKAVNQPATTDRRSASMSKTAMLALVDNLRATIQGLKWEPQNTQWGDYYGSTNYSSDAMGAKRKLVEEFLKGIQPAPLNCWDLGANTGEFSRIAADMGLDTVAWDVDPAAVEKGYLGIRGKGGKLLPLLQDLTNPSPSLGWANAERDSLVKRGPADVVMALALIHHLAIGNNVPLGWIARFFAQVGRNLIVEFVPKEDSQVERLLASRKDIFSDYDLSGFELAFQDSFTVVRKEEIPGTKRTLYLMARREL